MTSYVLNEKKSGDLRKVYFKKKTFFKFNI